MIEEKNSGLSPGALLRFVRSHFQECRSNLGRILFFTQMLVGCRQDVMGTSVSCFTSVNARLRFALDDVTAVFSPADQKGNFGHLMASNVHIH